MGISHEEEHELNLEGIIHEAEEAASPDVKGMSLTLNLPFGVARDLYLYIIMSDYVVPKEPIPFQETSYSVIGKKLEKALGLDENVAAQQDESAIVTFEISNHELDFINQNQKFKELPGSFLRKEAFQRNPTLSDEESCQWIGIDLEKLKEIRRKSHHLNLIMLRIFVSLNKAWIKAGGTPKPDFVKFYEGSDS